LIFSGVSGGYRKRMPVTSNIAWAMAADRPGRSLTAAKQRLFRVIEQRGVDSFRRVLDAENGVSVSWHRLNCTVLQNFQRNSFPFRGKAGMGWGGRSRPPIPTPAPPLQGREFSL